MAKDCSAPKDPNKVHPRKSSGIPQALSVGEIARRLGVRTHVVTKYVNTRGIQPVAWAGASRIFDEKVLNEIRCWLDGRTDKMLNRLPAKQTA